MTGRPEVPAAPVCAFCRGPLDPDASPFGVNGQTYFVACSRCTPLVAGAIAGAGQAARTHLMPRVIAAGKELLGRFPVLGAAVDGYVRAKGSRR